MKAYFYWKIWPKQALLAPPSAIFSFLKQYSFFTDVKENHQVGGWNNLLADT